MRDQDTRRRELAELLTVVESVDDVRPVLRRLIEIVQELDDANYTDLENLG